MTTLDPEAGHLVVINTFDVEPDRAEELLAALQRSTDDFVRKVPGFVSANWHVSLDRRHVTNYAQWRSKADLDAFMADPAARESIGTGSAAATSANPVLYSLRTTHAAAGVTS